jgi:hypothetical protein
MRGRQRRFDRGASLVEAAMVLPLLVALLCGIIDFGFLFSRQLTARNGAHFAARAAAVADVGTDTGCTLTPRPASDVTAALMCLAKHRSGVPAGDLRVKLVFGADGHTRGKPLAVCTEYEAHSVTGLFGPVLNGKVIRNKTEYRIEQVVADAPLAAAEEASFRGSWSWCTP